MSRLPAFEHGVVLGMHHVQLSYALAQQTLVQQFYGQWLGLPQLQTPVTASSHVLSYVAGAQRIDLVPRLTGQYVGDPQGHVALHVAGIEALHQRLLDHGGVALAMVQVDEGLRFYAKDPAGNTLELLQPLALAAPRARAAQAESLRRMALLVHHED